MKAPLLLTALLAAPLHGVPLPKGPPPVELVMKEGDRITATTTAGKITILAGKDFTRTYTWDGATRSADLIPRAKRWYGSMGIYFPGPGEHWEPVNGITRGVLQEGQQHFPDNAQALKWLGEQSGYYPTVHTSTGLVVSFGKVPGRKQINVEVWQILINGQPPVKLAGATDIKVGFQPAPPEPKKSPAQKPPFK